ncbi:hypothetical protein CPC08DRAFT_762510 [Agrocybe pediades]|nr:hypothetical protein CPC08DRAFT_762510 [Agrocybe pediades]
MPRNPYNFDHTKEQLPQFLALLGIETKSEAAEAWKARLTRITTRCLDLNRTTSQQPRAMLYAEEELRRMWPDTFGEVAKGDFARYYGMRVIIRNHTKRRAAHNLCIPRVTKRRDKALQKVQKDKRVAQLDVIDLTHEDSGSEIEFIGLTSLNIAGQLRTKLKNVPSSATPVRSNPSKRVHKHLHIDPPQSSSIEEPKGARIKVEEDEGELPQQSNGIAFVYDFLSSCKPSMAPLLHIFLGHGCNSEGYVRSVARWNSARRDEWLRRLIKRHGGTAVDDGDIVRLSVHFATFAS